MRFGPPDGSRRSSTRQPPYSCVVIYYIRFQYNGRHLRNVSAAAGLFFLLSISGSERKGDRLRTIAAVGYFMSRNTHPPERRGHSIYDLGSGIAAVCSCATVAIFVRETRKCFDGREAGFHVRNRDVYCSTAPCDIKSIPRLLLHPPHIHPKRPRPCLHQGVPPFSINPWEKPRSSWSRTRSLYTGTATNSDEGNCINTVCVVGYMLVYIYIYIVYFIARLSLFGALLSVADSLFFPFFHFVFWRKR